MATISETLAKAVEHHQAGRLQDAENAYRQILQDEPQHADAWHLLGVVASQNGNHAEAVDCIHRAIKTNPTAPEYHFNLGNVLTSQSQLDQAIVCYRKAVVLNPKYAKAHNELGIALKNQGHLDEAIACYRQALALKPGDAEAYYNLGNALQDDGRLVDAEASYWQAVALNSGFAEAHNNLGNALRTQGRLEEAEVCCRRAVAIKPEYAKAHNNLGSVLHAQGRLEESEICCRQALALHPEFTEAHNDLGNTLRAQGRLEEAVACYQQALALKPGYAEVQCNLGNVLKDQGKLEQAEVCYRQAVALKPGFTEVHNNLGILLQAQGKLDEAVACYQQVLALKPGDANVHSNLLIALQYRASVTVAELAKAHAEFERQHAAPLRATWRPHGQSRDPNRRLKLGFVSADFGRHPVGYFLIRVLEHLNPQQTGIACYSNRLKKDEITARFQAVASTWREVVGWSDERLADQIREDEIDILFDLAGHMAGNRLLVFARKPAPIQITWLGYVGTTGLKAIDYLIADQNEIPANIESDYQEQVLRMPDGYVCYDPPSDAPPVSPLPALEKGFVTFGCFNNPAKLTASVIEVWAKILQQVPNSRLVLKYQGMSDPTVSGRISDLLSSQGIDKGRVKFLGMSPHKQLLAEYGRIDLALDSFPYSGGLTTCEAMWMGVPVITTPGETFAGRHSLSHLSNVGLTETIARDFNEYVELAVELAQDLDRLAAIRSRLREQVTASPLCDGPRFAGKFLDRLREAWRQYVRTTVAARSQSR